ncbi:LZTR1, partial [Symbiodinium natans]
SAGRILLGLLLQAGCVQPAQDLSWEEIPTGGPGPPATGSHSAVLDACGTMWAFGGWTGDGSGDAPSHALLNFTTQDLSWEQIQIGSPWPPATTAHSAVLDADGTMWVFGGWTDDDIIADRSNALWKFTTQDLSWEQIQIGSPWPPATTAHSAVLDADGTMWVFGGWTAGSGKSNALWKFTTQAQFPEANDNVATCSVVSISRAWLIEVLVLLILCALVRPHASVANRA